MARGYTIDKYKKIIENIRILMPNASITADAIVAFPGEKESQFNRTLNDFIKIVIYFFGCRF